MIMGLAERGFLGVYQMSEGHADPNMASAVAARDLWVNLDE